MWLMAIIMMRGKGKHLPITVFFILLLKAFCITQYNSCFMGPIAAAGSQTFPSV